MYIVIVNEDNIPKEIVCITPDAQIAVTRFLDACRQTNSDNWGKLTVDDIAAILGNASYQFDNGAIVLMDVSKVKSDEEILADLSKTPLPGVHKITDWISTGEIGKTETIDEVLAHAAIILDRCEASEMLGDVIFRAEDGQVYTLTVEAQISRIHSAQ